MHLFTHTCSSFATGQSLITLHVDNIQWMYFPGYETTVPADMWKYVRLEVLTVVLLKIKVFWQCVIHADARQLQLKLWKGRVCYPWEGHASIRRSGGTSPCILNHGTRWNQAASHTPLGKSPLHQSTPKPLWILCITEQPLSPAARYWLHYSRVQLK